MSSSLIRDLWAIGRNALTWAVAWGLAGGAIAAGFGFFDPGVGVGFFERIGGAVLIGGMWGVRFAIAGGVIGTLFAGAIRFGYRGRRLADISPIRFALLGAVVGAVGVPLFFQAMNILSGTGPIAWHLVTDDAVWASVFGATVAGGTILLARRAERLSAGKEPEQLDSGLRLDDLEGSDRESTTGRRSTRTP